MRKTWIAMGMPVALEIVSDNADEGYATVFEYLAQVDQRLSPYRQDSELSWFNEGMIAENEISHDLAEIFALAEQTKKETNGYFDMRRPDGSIDPSGIVKGWAIHKAAEQLRARGYNNFCIDVGGDIVLSGSNQEGEQWSVGIRNPFNHDEIVKVLYPKMSGIATSGSAARGNHIYNPHNPTQVLDVLASITVLGPSIIDADRFATAAFAMGKEGVIFIESLPSFEAYAIDVNGIATMTSGFDTHTHI